MQATSSTPKVPLPKIALALVNISHLVKSRLAKSRSWTHLVCMSSVRQLRLSHSLKRTVSTETLPVQICNVKQFHSSRRPVQLLVPVSKAISPETRASSSSLKPTVKLSVLMVTLSKSNTVQKTFAPTNWFTSSSLTTTVQSTSAPSSRAATRSRKATFSSKVPQLLTVSSRSAVTSSLPLCHGAATTWMTQSFSVTAWFAMMN